MTTLKYLFVILFVFLVGCDEFKPPFAIHDNVSIIGTNIKAKVIFYRESTRQYQVLYEDKNGALHIEWLYYQNLAKEPSA